VRASFVLGNLVAVGQDSTAPQQLWPGYQDTTSLAMMAWPPTTQAGWTAATFIGSVSGTVLTVSSGTPPQIGQTLGTGTITGGNIGPVIPGGITIVSGGSGTFNLSAAPGTIAAGSTMYTTGGTSGVPDYYEVYDNGTLICGGSTNTANLNNPGVTADAVVTFGQYGLAGRPIPWFVHKALTPGSTHSYQWLAVTAGNLSALSPALVMSTLNVTASILPQAPADPATWIQDGTGVLNINTFVPPVGGTKWTATVTTAATTSSNGWNTPGTGTKNATGCGYLYALQNASPNDIIVLTANAFYASPGTGWPSPTNSAAGGWIYVVSSQEPVINPGGTLPAYTFNSNEADWTILTCTAAPGANATSATLSANQPGLTDSSGNWLLKSGWYKVMFRKGAGSAMVNEERMAVFTNASSTVNWANTNGLLPSAGLSAAASATIQVQYTTAVTPWDALTGGSMPTLQFGSVANQACIALNSAATKVRYVGINLQPLPSLSASLLTYFQFSNTSPPTASDKCSHIYLDRCLIGDDYNSSTFSFSQHGISGINCDYFLVHQTYIYGICQNWSGPGSGDTNNYGQGGGWHCWQQFYVSCGSENLIYGGVYVLPPPNLPHDIVVRNFWSDKPASWIGGQNVTVSAWVGTEPNITAATLSGNWLYPTSSTYVIQNGNQKARVTLTNGSNTASISSWVPALTSTPPTGLWIVADTGPGGIGVTTPWWNFGRQIKDHFEFKAGQYALYDNGVFLNAWVGTNVGYHSAPFAWGSRDQVLAAALATSMTGGCPWNLVTDVKASNIKGLNIGSPFYAFTGDGSASGYTARLQMENCLFYVNPLLPASERVLGIRVQGPIPDIIVDHVTLITNTVNQNGAGVGVPYGTQWVTGGTGNGGYVTGTPYTPNGFTPGNARFTFTNNIIDSGAGPNLAFNFLNPAQTFDLFQGVLTVAKNVTINDTTTYQGTTGGATYVPGTYNGVPYASLGFTRWDGNTVMPLQASDWAVTQPTTSGTYSSLTASTTGGTVGATFAAPPAQGLAAAPYPRIGVYAIGGNLTGFTSGNCASGMTFAATMAYYNFIINSGYEGDGLNWPSLMQTWKANAAAKNTLNNGAKLWITRYNMLTELFESTSDDPGMWQYPINCANNSNWWLRDDWPSGAIVAADKSQNGWVNVTPANTVACASFSQNGVANPYAGQSIWKCFANFTVDANMNGTNVSKYGENIAVAANPYLDGIMLDNQFCIPRSAGSWDMGNDNTSPNRTNALSIQAGWGGLVAAFRAYQPGIIMVGNPDLYNNAGNSNVVPISPSWAACYDGAIMEGFFGYSGGEASGFATGLANIAVQEQLLTPNGVTLIGSYGEPNNGAAFPSSQSSWTSGAGGQWQLARYEFGMAQLRTSYFTPNMTNNTNPTGAVLFDELYQTAPGAGSLSTGWLSYGIGPSDPLQSASWSQGCYLRRFPGGAIIVNPRGNGAQTFTVGSGTGQIPSSMSRCASNTISGTQAYGDTAVNTGAAVSGTVTLQDTDALFLVGIW
jgi:hypothetical protein